MSTLAQSYVSLARDSSRSEAAAGRRGVIRRLADKVMLEIEVRRARRLLRSFDDALLRDIGISRSEIDHAVRHGNQDALSNWMQHH